MMKYAIYHSSTGEKKVTLQKLEWTTTPPTEPGWYQVYSQVHDDPVEFIRLAKQDGYDEFVIYDTGWVDAEISDFTHWLGPIPLAEPPKETE